MPAAPASAARPRCDAASVRTAPAVRHKGRVLRRAASHAPGLEDAAWPARRRLRRGCAPGDDAATQRGAGAGLLRSHAMQRSADACAASATRLPRGSRRPAAAADSSATRRRRSAAHAARARNAAGCVERWPANRTEPAVRRAPSSAMEADGGASPPAAAAEASAEASPSAPRFQGDLTKVRVVLRLRPLLRREYGYPLAAERLSDTRCVRAMRGCRLQSCADNAPRNRKRTPLSLRCFAARRASRRCVPRPALHVRRGGASHPAQCGRIARFRRCADAALGLVHHSSAFACSRRGRRCCRRRTRCLTRRPRRMRRVAGFVAISACWLRAARHPSRL